MQSINRTSNVSLIIPAQNAEAKLFKLFKLIPEWDAIPNEIIIIDSSKNLKLKPPEDFKLFTKKIKIKLLIIYGDNLYPGHARNIGITNATNSLLAFLDTSTYPNKEWLSQNLKILEKHNSDGVWGLTYYSANSYSSKIFRACTYGDKPIITLPGSIFEKSVFYKCGYFIESVRAGEDGDWMSRVSLQNINMSNSTQYLNYNELNNLSLLELFKKYFTYNTFVSKLPFFRAHKDFYYYAISFIAVLIAFNWNMILASWDEESIFYIPNITKISVLVILVLYIYLRGVMLPKKKGVNIKFIFPINFIFISIFSGLLDIIKAMAFIYSKFTIENNIEDH
jgi:glycosyltransferase involved in cell wall biosynthesis